MKKHLLYLLLFLPHLTLAQYDVELEWVIKNQTNSGGGGAYYETPRVLADGQGGVYYCGSTYHPGPGTGLLIIRYDGEGNALWKDTLDDPSIDELGDALVDKNGNLILVRNASSPFGFYTVYVVIKYSPSGERLWEYLNFENDVPSRLGDMEIDENGDLYLFGRWADHTDSIYALATIKLDGESGEVLWENELTDTIATFSPLRGRLLEDRLMVLAKKRGVPRTYILHQVDLEGQSIYTAENDYPDPAEFNHWAHIDREGNTYLGVNAWGYRLAKIAPSGDTLWVYEREPSSAGIVRNRMVSIHSDDNLNVYCTGPYYQSNENVYITTTKLNSEGEIIWQHDFAEIPQETPSFPNISFVSDSILFIMGVSQTPITPDSNDVNFLIVAYSLDGDELFYTTYEDGMQNESANSGSFDEQNNLFIAGYNYYHWPDERNDQYILKYHIDINTKTFEIATSPIRCRVFPNPLNGQSVQVEAPAGQRISNIRFFDSGGKLLPIIQRAGNQIVLGTLSAGIYWLEISWPEGKEVHRLVKQQ